MKFSIRDLFLVTVIVALALGWWIDHRGKEEEADRLFKTLEASENFHREQVDAFEAALDELKPNWREADGSYSFEGTPKGMRLAPPLKPLKSSKFAPDPSNP